MAKLNMYDIVRVVASCQLNGDDIQVLSLLYQPLIGVDSFALYFALYNLLDRQKMVTEKIMHKEILDILNFKINELDVARKKLEAVGLLRVLKSDVDYVYFINMPLSAKVFMSGDLGPFLYSKIGDALFKKLYNQFVIEKIDRSDYIEITKCFDDVFESNSQAIISDELLLERKSGQIKINNSSFDMDVYLNGMKAFIDRRKVTDRFRQTILRLAYTYGFNPQEMINVTMSAYNGQTVDTGILSKRARDYYSAKNKAQTPNLVLKEETENENDILDSITPKEILETMSGMGASVSELNNINEIWEKTEWSKGVINAFLMYILKIKDGRLPNVNYLDKVASEWKRMGIDDSKKAREFLSLQETRKNEGTKVSEKKEDDWLSDWYKKVGDIKYE